MTAISDDPIPCARNTGRLEYRATFRCNFRDGDGKSCGHIASGIHYRGQCCRHTAHLRTHVRKHMEPASGNDGVGSAFECSLDRKVRTPSSLLM